MVSTGSFTLAWPWLLAVALLGVLALAWWAWRDRRARSDAARWLANTAYLDDVPELQRALRHYRLVRAAAAAVLALAVLSAAVLAARPVDRVVTAERFGTRDIVLCLDVSGSMVPFDSAITRTFAQLVDSFSGERIALSIFNSTSRTVFPLTDDYTLVLEELAIAEQALSLDLDNISLIEPEEIDRLLAFIAGTEEVPDAASLIGDGLASCALLFDEQDTERSRSIILATDNVVFGEPIYTLPQAVDLVASRDVQLYGLYGGAPDLRGSPQNEEFDSAIVEAGGATWFAEDGDAVASVIDDVIAQQAVALDAEAKVRLTDRPHPWFGLLLAGVVGLLVLRWRARE